MLSERWLPFWLHLNVLRRALEYSSHASPNNSAHTVIDEVIYLSRNNQWFIDYAANQISFLEVWGISLTPMGNAFITLYGNDSTKYLIKI